jgi:CheY-like chemotaxis protein
MEHLQRGTRPIDLVLADVVLPHMSGTELAAHVVARQPGLPVVLMSAYAPEDLARRGLVLSHGHLLTKPFTPEQPLGLIRRPHIRRVARSPKPALLRYQSSRPCP